MPPPPTPRIYIPPHRPRSNPITEDQYSTDIDITTGVFAIIHLYGTWRKLEGVDDRTTEFTYQGIDGTGFSVGADGKKYNVSLSEWEAGSTAQVGTGSDLVDQDGKAVRGTKLATFTVYDESADLPFKVGIQGTGEWVAKAKNTRTGNSETLTDKHLEDVLNSNTTGYPPYYITWGFDT